jgi:cytochrome c biogenesis protein CcdA
MIVAFAAGLLSFGSPCVLPMVPAYLSYIAGASVTPGTDARTRGATALHTVAFVAGFVGLLIFLGAWVGLLRWMLAALGDSGAVAANLTEVTYVLRDILVRVGSVALAVLGVRVARAVWGPRPWVWLAVGAALAAVTWWLSTGTPVEAVANAVVLGAVPLLGWQRGAAASGAVALGIVAANASHFFLTATRPPTPLDAAGVLVESVALGLVVYVGSRTWRFYQTAGLMPVGAPVPRSYLSSAGVGLVFGAGWTPCTGPNLAMILALAAAASTAMSGTMLLVAYGAGLAVPFLAAGLIVGGASHKVPTLGRFAPAVATANAALLLVMSALAITGSLAQLAGTPWLLQRLR